MAARILPHADYLRECLIYDPDTGVVTWRERPRHHFKSDHAQLAWNAKMAGKIAGSEYDIADGRGRLRITIDGIRYGLSRIVWKLVTGEEPTKLIDHKNTDPSDNRWLNLRPATSTQNNHNRDGGGEHLKGTYLTPSGRWIATISVNNSTVHLGRFDTEAEAHAAYCEAAQTIHGDYANPGHQS